MADAGSITESAARRRAAAEARRQKLLSRGVDRLTQITSSPGTNAATCGTQLVGTCHQCYQGLQRYFTAEAQRPLSTFKSPRSKLKALR